MEQTEYIEKLDNKNVEIKSLVKRTGTFETENGQKIPFKNYLMKIKIGSVIYKFKLDKTFNDTLEEELENE